METLPIRKILLLRKCLKVRTLKELLYLSLEEKYENKLNATRIETRHIHEIKNKDPLLNIYITIIPITLLMAVVMYVTNSSTLLELIDIRKNVHLFCRT